MFCFLSWVCVHRCLAETIHRAIYNRSVRINQQTVLKHYGGGQNLDTLTKTVIGQNSNPTGMWHFKEQLFHVNRNQINRNKEIALPGLLSFSFIHFSESETA